MGGNESIAERAACTEKETDRMAVDVLVDLSTEMAIIGVMIGLFLRAERRTDEVEARFESRFDKVDERFGSMARDLVEVKVFGCPDRGLPAGW